MSAILNKMPSPPGTDDVRQILSQIIDPETGANIVDMGLIYDVGIQECDVSITMTMTSPACPMGGMILEDIEETLRRYLPHGYTSNVRVVWEPAWDPSMMSMDLRERFGINDLP